jgi:hypothetical protein
MWQRAVEAWRRLPSDADAVFDREVVIDVEAIIPQVTWGISPEHVIGVDGHVPDPQAIADPARRAAIETALDYMGLEAGAPIIGTPVDWVFIGSCTNSRLSDLRAAAEVARGRKVAPGVRAWVVPGSETVKRDAVAEGLDKLSPTPASNGASPDARCVWPPMAKRYLPASARSRHPTAISSAARGRAPVPIWRVQPRRWHQRFPARSPTCG